MYHEFQNNSLKENT